MFPLYWQFIKKLIGIGKKVVLVVVVYAIVIALFSHFLKQDKPKLTSDPIKENRKEIYAMMRDLETNKTPQGKIALATFRIMTCSMIGEICTDNPNDADNNFNKSIFGFVSNMILVPYQNPPASGVMWAMNGLQNAGFIPKTYAAQGIGFGIVQPFSKIWVVFRDLAYTLLVLFIIAIGFMIMFRMKLNPQTVIGVENALPRIVLALILITFSFAIAGFMIDLMYVSIALIVSLLGPMFKPETLGGPLNIPIPGAPQGTPQQITAQLQQRYLMAYPGDILSGLQKEGSLGFFTIFFALPNALLDLVPMVGATIKTVGTVLSIYLMGPWLHNRWKDGAEVIEKLLPLKVGAEFVGKAEIDIGGLLSGLMKGQFWIPWAIALWIGAYIFIPFLLGLIIFCTVIFIFFRILIILFTSYLKILLLTIISPIYLLFEIIPGRSAFSGWIKHLLAELISFPIIVGVLIMGTIISDTASSGSIIQLPFLVGIEPKSFGFIVGMAVLFMTPELVKTVKQVLVPKPGILDAGGLGLFFGGATTAVSGGLGELSKYAGIGFYIKPIRDLLTKLPGGKQLFNFEQHKPGGE